MAPSIAVKLSDMLYLGATFNINYGFFKTDQWGGYMALTPTAPPAGAVAAAPMIINFGQQTLNVKGWGFGATFGILVKPADWISFGATYRTQAKMKLAGTTEIENINLIGLENESNTDMSVVSPMWLAGGVAIKPIDKLTLTFDAHYTNWSKLQEIALTFEDPVWDAALSEDAALVLNWANKTQIRFGAEYDLGTFAIRGGYYHDPAPAPDDHAEHPDAELHLRQHHRRLRLQERQPQGRPGPGIPHGQGPDRRPVRRQSARYVPDEHPRPDVRPELRLVSRFRNAFPGGGREPSPHCLSRALPSPAV